MAIFTRREKVVANANEIFEMQASNAPRPRKKKKTSWYKEAMKDIKKPTTTDEEKKEQQKQHLSSLPKMTFDKLERI